MRLFLAYRFLKSKDNSGFINIISKISIIGIILGITVLITVMSVMNGFEQQLKDKVLGFTSHVTLYGENLNSIETITLMNELVDDQSILAYSFYNETESLLISNTQSSAALVRSVDPSLEANVNIIYDNIIQGDYKKMSDPKSIALGVGLANKLNVSIGDLIYLVSKPQDNNLSLLQNTQENYIVVAIFDVGLYEYNNSYAFKNIKEITPGKSEQANKIRIKLDNPLYARTFSESFNRKYSEIYSQDWTISHQSLFTAISNEKKVMFVILILIIAVASFNIVSSLLMLVKNKEKEISILKTLGASKSYIISIFLAQGIFLGLIGIFFGVLFGIFAANNINTIIDSLELIFDISLLPAEIYHLSEIPALIKLSDIQFIVIFSFIIIFISSLYPANRAASVNPADKLRGTN
ncbi:MAG: hypothetical protein CMD82_01460 [Gammaproteobacteria bacterium]|nr:hypothetical protein [Gammaproteobacteria bacterium]|tara:strand:+ start:46821 stop:48047 length:1227 start_codon:yes stop_codon:yes gene_type:complete